MSSNNLTAQGGSAHSISFSKRLTNSCDLHGINCGFLLASPRGVQIPFMIRFLTYFLYSPFYLPILHFPKILLLFLMCILRNAAFVLWLWCLFYLLWLNIITPLRPSPLPLPPPNFSLSLLCINFIITLSGPFICHLHHRIVEEYVLSIFQPTSSTTSQLSSFPSLSCVTVPPP